ncbi:MAG: DUF1571 domain-containing protein [Bacteroidetes bacterium]|nr:MAG: DUF1571 domain-containing protein [Bacteroidota bacterium]REK04947.1 MAG: DUF1571 domain-containing protein [Bacteroidota bacterium]REK36549.1 MAG: DUF1571 domain-containing protein [Bacteroidota bacterium]REK50915.1 MAG: DUF1571 domain-containing protein [Bacteroidota bacterium]
MIARLTILFLLLFKFASSNSPDIQAKHVFNLMLDRLKNVSTASFRLLSTERMKDGKISQSDMLVKLQSKPQRIYIYCVNPNPGVEVLWPISMTDDRMLINPNGFPYVNLKINQQNSLVRKNTHHIIEEIGFNYLSDMISYYIDMYGENFYRYIRITDTITYDNKSCIRLVYDFSDYDMILYLVKKNESLTDIAGRFKLSDYHLLCLNPSIKDYTDIHAGQIIRIPNFYNRKIEFIIDRKSYMPLVQTVSDEKGMYEKYEWRNIILNPELSEEDFSPLNKKYGFR